MKDLINPSFPIENFNQIEEIVNTSVYKLSTDEDIALLQQLFLGFSNPNWEQDALAALDQLIKDAKSNKDEVHYFAEALDELSDHAKNKNLPTKDREMLLTLFYAAYQLALYEFSSDRLTKVGDIFKAQIADNVDPVTGGHGSLAGYNGRFRQYMAMQIPEKKDNIKQFLEDSKVKKKKF